MKNNNVHEDTTQWVLKNETINLSQFLTMKPVTETPLKTSLQMHWALLDGHVPLVPENMLPPKEKVEMKKSEPDPMTVILKKKEVVPKKKISRDHKREIPLTKEIKEFYTKFLEIYNIEEIDNRTGEEKRKTTVISSDFLKYFDIVRSEPSVVNVIPAIVDFIYNKCIDYITSKEAGDAKMLFICVKIITCLLENEFYN
jgi:hypothetical protein